MAGSAAMKPNDQLISARNIACDTEGCEDRAIWRTAEGAFCDGCHTFIRAGVDHSAQGNCDCYPQCAKAAAERGNR